MQRTAVLSALAIAAGTASAQFTFFTDAASWQAALGGAAVVNEDFNGVAVGDYTDSAIATSLMTLTHTGGAQGSDMTVVDGADFGNLDGTNSIDSRTGGAPGGTISITFAPGSVFAFGGDFFSPFSGAGIDIVVDGNRFALDHIAGFGSGFAGVVSTGSFSEVTIEGNYSTGTFQELWNGDNFRYAVPAPGAIAVLGLGGLIATRRRR